ncbi:MAG: hypothetical protein SGPRY_001375 [Prymnesium sp.]
MGSTAVSSRDAPSSSLPPTLQAGAKRPHAAITPTPRLRVTLGAAASPQLTSCGYPKSPAMNGAPGLPPPPPPLQLAPDELKAATAASHSPAPLGDGEIKFAPRATRYVLARAHEDFQMSAFQFAQLLNGPEHVSQSQVNRWESGLDRIPVGIASKVEKLHAGLLRKLAMAQQPAEEAMVLVKPEYPNQEPMLGGDYQAVVPKQGGGGKEKKEVRRDACVWSIRNCAREGINVDAYIEEVSAILHNVHGLEHDEPTALTVLHDLKYNQRTALDALRLCVAWEQRNLQSVAELPRRSPAILWLQRLRAAALDSKKRWTAGQKEALDAGCRKHGKELAEVYKHVLQELPYPKFIQLYYQCSHLPRPPDSP